MENSDSENLENETPKRGARAQAQLQTQRTIVTRSMTKKK